MNKPLRPVDIYGSLFTNGKGECLFVQSMVGGGLSDGRRRGRQLYNNALPMFVAICGVVNGLCFDIIATRQ